MYTTFLHKVNFQFYGSIVQTEKITATKLWTIFTNAGMEWM